MESEPKANSVSAGKTGGAPPLLLDGAAGCPSVGMVSVAVTCGDTVAAGIVDTAPVSIDEKRRALLDAGVHSPTRQYNNTAVEKAFRQHLCSLKPKRLEPAMVMVEATGTCDGTVAPGGASDPSMAEMATSELRKEVAADSVTAGDGVTLTQDPGDTKETEKVYDEESGGYGVLAPPPATALDFAPPAGDVLLVADTRGCSALIRLRSGAKEAGRELCSARLAARLAAMKQPQDQLSEPITRSKSRLEQKKD